MNFSEIPGNETIKHDLIRKIQSGRVPHAQLFVGPEGSAKLALALAFSQYMHCVQPTGTDSCGVCMSCIKAAKFIHPDIHFSFPVVNRGSEKSSSSDFIKKWRKVLDENVYMDYVQWMGIIAEENRQGNIPVKECREIISKLALKPFESDKKTLIMWLPEYLGKEGNVLLKILEEPPEGTYFILVACHYDLILPTILSRTQLVKIQAFEENDIKRYLSENLDTIPENPDQLAFMANGSINRALQLIEDQTDNHTESFREWMLMCHGNNMLKLVSWSNQCAGLGRESVKNFLHNGLTILRECLMIRYTNAYETKVPEVQKKFVINFSKVLNRTAIEALYIKMNEAIYHIERNANAKILLFNLSLTFTSVFQETKNSVEN
jgi:DNA polymerase-3 subunit delta'